MTRKEFSSAPNAAINVTPLVDVILVLLIIFMVITPALHQGFAGKVPPKASGPGAAQAVLVLELKDDGTLALNRQAVPDGELGERLTALYAARADRTLFLKVEDGVHVEKLVQIMDTCRRPGRAEALAFVLE